jgi:hypothetical protein
MIFDNGLDRFGGPKVPLPGAESLVNVGMSKRVGGRSLWPLVELFRVDADRITYFFEMLGRDRFFVIIENTQVSTLFPVSTWDKKAGF